MVESWFYGYDRETKQQSNEWKTAGTPRQKRLLGEIRYEKDADLFFDNKEVIHSELFPANQSVPRILSTSS